MSCQVKTIVKISFVVFLFFAAILLIVDCFFVPHAFITFKNQTVALSYEDQLFVNLEDHYFFVDYNKFLKNATPVRIGRFSLFSKDRAFFLMNKYAFVENNGLAEEYGVYINDELDFPELSTENISYVEIIDTEQNDKLLTHVTDTQTIKNLIMLYQEYNNSEADYRFEVNFVFKDNILLFSTYDIPDNLIKEIIK